jgi:hypothetical protein
MHLLARVLTEPKRCGLSISPAAGNLTNAGLKPMLFI